MVPNDVRVPANTVERVHSYSSDIVRNEKPTEPPTTNDNMVSATEQDTTVTVAATEVEDIEQEIEEDPELDIVINNVVCAFNVGCHLNLRTIATKGVNVEHKRENGMAIMKLRRPYTTASIWKSGSVTCIGATSEDQAKIAARRFARAIGKLGFPVRFRRFRVVNVLATCSMPWTINIIGFSRHHKKYASYEPELHPGVTYHMMTPKATLKIFSTGSITVASGNVNNVQQAIESIYPLLFDYRKDQRDPASYTEDIPDPDLFNDDEDFLNDDSLLTYGVGNDMRRRRRPHASSNGTNGQQWKTKNGATTKETREEYVPSNARVKATTTWATKQQNNRPYYKGQVYGNFNGLSSGNRFSAERTEKPPKSRAPANRPKGQTDADGDEEAGIPAIALKSFDELIEEEDDI